MVNAEFLLAFTVLLENLRLHSAGRLEFEAFLTDGVTFYLNVNKLINVMLS